MTAGGSNRVIPPHSGRHVQVSLRRVLSEGVAVDGARGESLDRTLHRVGRMARHPGLVVVASDFRDPGDWQRALRALAARHRVLAVEVRDPREIELPGAGRLALVDPETGRLLEVDTSSAKLRERFAAAAREERAEVASKLRRAGARHVILSTDRDWLKDLGRALQ